MNLFEPVQMYKEVISQDANTKVNSMRVARMMAEPAVRSAYAMMFIRASGKGGSGSTSPQRKTCSKGVVMVMNRDAIERTMERTVVR